MTVRKKKKSRKLSSYPKNVPRALIRAYRLVNENGLKLAKQLDVNDAHLSKLFNKGIEPTDTNIRRKLMLTIHPICKCCGRKIINRKQSEKKDTPEYMKKWKHLSTDERNKVIQEYLKWRDR